MFQAPEVMKGCILKEKAPVLLGLQAGAGLCAATFVFLFVFY